MSDSRFCKPKASFLSGSYLLALIIYFTGSILIKLGANYVIKYALLSTLIGVVYCVINHLTEIYLVTFPGKKQTSYISTLNSKLSSDDSKIV